MCARKQELLSMQGTKLELEKCRVLILQRVWPSVLLQNCSWMNKCRPTLVQGLQREIKINFLTINIYGSVAKSVE